jgi:putative transposase
VKYRHKVLTPEIIEDLVQILEKIAINNNFEILEFNADQDHVHILIDCSPQHFIPDIMKAIKGVSTRLLMKKYGDVLRKELCGGHLWNPSYFITTVSENTETVVREYIKSQGKKD